MMMTKWEKKAAASAAAAFSFVASYVNLDSVDDGDNDDTDDGYDDGDDDENDDGADDGYAIMSLTD